MTRIRLASLLAVVAVGALLWTNWPSHAATTPTSPAMVRLYSNGQVVGTWQAVGPARVEAGTLVFPVRKGARDFDVRISGTYSVEEQP